MGTMEELSMPRQLSERIIIKRDEVFPEDDFPIFFLRYTQKFSDFHTLHYHNSFEIGLCIEGSGTFFIENKAFTFNPGDITFIYPGQPHIAQSPNELPSKWFFIAADFDRLFLENVGKSNMHILWENKYQIPYIVHSNLNLAKIIKMIVDEMEHKEQDYQLIIKELLLCFSHMLLRQCEKREDDAYTLPDEFYSIAPALAYIFQQYHNAIFVRDMAKVCNLSETHFRVIFHRAIGSPPLQYLTIVRMKMAKTLLKSTNMQILNIAHNVGYSSISSFNRAFKSHFTQTPTAYRAKDQKNNTESK